MHKVTFIALAITALVLQSRACIGPSNIEGVAFTSDEALNLQALTTMGVENVNYFRDGDTTTTGIRYKSHYDPRVVVFVGNYGLSYQQGIRMSCMGVILPLPDGADVHTPIDRATFDFAAAVHTELKWLASNGIVAISAETIAAINDSLAKSGTAVNGGMQYWTHAASMLAYNSWYKYDTVAGTWQQSDANGVYGVRTPNETQGLSGCSVIKPGVGVPPEGLGTTAIASANAAAVHPVRPLAVRHLGNGSLVVFLPQQVTQTGREVVIFDCRGAVAGKKQIPAGMTSVYINGLAPGRYHAQLIK